MQTSSKILNSKYKLLGGTGLLLALNIIIGLSIYALLKNSNLKLTFDQTTSFSKDSEWLFILLLVGIQFIFLLLFVKQCPRIEISEGRIRFINPFLPFFSKTILHTEIDYLAIVEEHSRFTTYEAVWLIRDNKLTARFSSFYYKNYYQLKTGIKAKRRVTLRINPIKQLLILLRISKVE